MSVPKEDTVCGVGAVYPPRDSPRLRLDGEPNVHEDHDHEATDERQRGDIGIAVAVACGDQLSKDDGHHRPGRESRGDRKEPGNDGDKGESKIRWLMRSVTKTDNAPTPVAAPARKAISMTSTIETTRGSSTPIHKSGSVSTTR